MSFGRGLSDQMMNWAFFRGAAKWDSVAARAKGFDVVRYCPRCNSKGSSRITPMKLHSL